MQKIEICLTPKLIDTYSLNNKIVIIVDILRATSIITTLFKNGLSKLIPVKTIEQAEEYKKEGYLVAAERNGKKVDFADFGNSPFEFTPDKIKDRTLVYSSTNGTNTIKLVKNAEMLLIASFLNLTSISDFIIKQNKDVLILCSGWMQDFCSEDFLFAGALTEKLISSGKFGFNSDQVQISLDIWNIAKKDLNTYIKRMFQYKRLVEFGFKEIVEYCFKSDLTSVIPILENDEIVNYK
jgi:2-phosphosulfolactate phosphatase